MAERENYSHGRRRYPQDDRGFFQRAKEEMREWLHPDEGRDHRGYPSGEREHYYGGQGDTSAYGYGGAYIREGVGQRPSDDQYYRGSRRNFFDERMGIGYGFDEVNPDFERRRRTGMSGKGPKNFRRTDARICEDVCRALRDHDAIDATDIDVEVVEGRVTLNGTVEDRAERRLTEEVVESIWGIRDVHNTLGLRANATQTESPKDSSDRTA